MYVFLFGGGIGRPHTYIKSIKVSQNTISYMSYYHKLFNIGLIHISLIYDLYSVQFFEGQEARSPEGVRNHD